MSGRLDGLVLLDGGCNFREVDRYRSGDGRYLRAGSLYRSGVLSYLTAADQRVVQQLGIRTIVDLRRAEERRREPTRWVEAGTTGGRTSGQTQLTWV